MTKSKLTLGPLFYNWDAAKRRDFYFRMADEAPIDVVYLGEVVCSKREPFYANDTQAIIDRLKNAGKEVVLSSLALVTTEREMQEIREADTSGFLIETNDVAALQALPKDKPFVVGPFINILNEDAMAFVKSAGAVRVVFPSEMTVAAMGHVAATSGGLECEVQVFGRQPLAVSMRCYHARAHGAHKDTCHIVCGQDPEGLPIQTIDQESFLTVNGTQLLSRGYVVLLEEMKRLSEQGVTHFRLSPQNIDMLRVSEIFRGVLDGKNESGEAMGQLKEITGEVPFVNGFQYGRKGLDWVENLA